MWSVSNAKVVKFEDRDRTGDDMDFIARKTGTAIFPAGSGALT